MTVLPRKLTTKPPTFPIATPELVPVPVDFANRLAVGETVANVVSVNVTDPLTGALVTGATLTPPTLVGTIVTQMVLGSALASRKGYWFEATVTVGTRRESTMTTLVVEF